MTLVRKTALLILLMLLPSVLRGQTPTTAPATTGDEMRVSILTMGPGDAAWEKFGHNMLRFQIPSRGIDAAFNWGLFEFDNNFIGNFLKGKLNYSMAPFLTNDAMQEYLQADREIWEQELNLSPSQKQKLWDYCRWNAEPENATYRYDYYRDNCSTRVRDAIDEYALLGQMKAQASTQPSKTNYRSETNRLMAGDFFTYTGLYFILGHPVDEPISVWDEMFIPMRMRVRLNQMTIMDQSGNRVPLVKQETHLHQSKRTPPPESPPNYLAIYLGIGAVLGGLQAWLVRSSRGVARAGFAIVSMFWALLAGFGGSFMLSTFTTDHAAARPNENILQLSPLLLPLVLIIPLAMRRWRKAGMVMWVLSAIALAASILGLLLQVLPMMNQVNGNIIALALPANAGLAYAAWRLSRLPAVAVAPVQSKHQTLRKGA